MEDPFSYEQRERSVKEKKRFSRFAAAWCGWLAGQVLLAVLWAVQDGSAPWDTAEALWALPGSALSLILFFVSVAGARGNLTWSKPEDPTDGRRRKWSLLCLAEGAFWLIAEGLLILRRLRVGRGVALLVVWSVLGVVVLITLALLLLLRANDRRHPDGKLKAHPDVYFSDLRLDSEKRWFRMKGLRFDGDELDCYNFSPDPDPQAFLRRMERLCKMAPALKERLWPAITEHLNGIAAEEGARPESTLTEAELRQHTRFFAAHTEREGELGLWAVWEPEQGGRQEVLIVYDEREDRFNLYRSRLYEWLM